MSYSLNTTILNPLSKEKPKNAVILCHGYGGDGKDISLLASYWRTYLPCTIFVCPDAPEKCAVSASGFQWFDLMDQTKDQVLVKSLVAEIKLNTLIDEVIERNNLTSEKVAIGGFSQGCMISLQTGLKRKKKINSIIPLEDKILFKKPSYFSKPLAKIKKGRVLIVQKCAGIWCKIKSENFNGWVKTDNIWGSVN